MLPVSSIADVWCKAGNGSIYARSVCKKSEKQLDLAALGLQGPQGLAGSQGPVGATGPAGKDAIIAEGCPDKIDGKYSGTFTESGFYNGQPVTTYGILNMTVVGNKTTISQQYSAGIFGPAALDEPVIGLSTAYSKETCVFSVEGDTIIYGNVSNGGKTINAVKGPKGFQNGSLVVYALTKQ